jgi:transcriptional regulator with XRE-family HTH domain
VQTLSEQIRRSVEKSGYGRNELARMIGIDKSTMSRFMSGERFLRVDALDRLAKVLKLRIIADSGAAKGRRTK